ncbi:hypothetical protein CCUS01_09813 [Colletotrichum cuscutae]|uniref:Uncharacterized protein n=1 Tax=Colletotrichum cuscutae TaxID=1209917 RepID=A0AAI9XQX3_9PEZI|nr:hypothetical protein CCUS01_09813 [Colletotrichum cuscutae]
MSDSGFEAFTILLSMIVCFMIMTKQCTYNGKRRDIIILERHGGHHEILVRLDIRFLLFLLLFGRNRLFCCLCFLLFAPIAKHTGKPSRKCCSRCQ